MSSTRLRWIFTLLLSSLVAVSAASVHSFELRIGRQVISTISQPAAASAILLVSFSGDGRIRSANGDVLYRDEDVLRYDNQIHAWSTFIDGSDLGIRGDVNAFSMHPDGSILFSLEAPEKIADLGLVDDSDILQFLPTSIGADTQGTLSVYFDGSDVGLTTSNEDIHALTVMDNGNLLISTNGKTVVPGLSVDDEDLLEFSPTSLGSVTSGTWSRFFDGSDVELARGSEDIRAATIEGNNLHFATLGAFSAGDVQGNSADIFSCALQLTGASTACQFTALTRGADSEIGSRAIDSFHYISGSGLLDTTAPTGIATYSPARNEFGWNNSDTTIEINWSDAGGIDELNCTKELQLATTGDALPYSATCADVSGNIAELNGFVSIDTQPPATSITTETVSTDNETRIFFSATDDLSGVLHFECSFNHSDFEVCNSPLQYTSLDTGSYLLTVRAIDIAGNTDQTGDSHSWTVASADVVAPEANRSAAPLPNESGWHNTDVLITFNWTDDSGIDPNNCTSSTLVTGEGSIDYNATCNDLNGNAGLHTGAVLIDKTAPTILIANAPTSSSASNNALFEFSAEDTLSGIASYECQLDSSGFTPCNSPVSYQNLANGAHEFAVKATDVADNTSATPLIYTWTIEENIPEGDTAANASRFLQMASLAATEEDISSVINNGREAWLDDQLARQEPGSRFDWLLDNGYKISKNVSRGFDFAVWKRLFTANNPVQQRWVLALSEIFVINVDDLSGPQGWRGFGGAAYLDMLETHGLGNYRNLLEEVTLNLQMGEYLSLKGSKKRDGSGRAPDENYAREVLQLFSIGLYELNADGTLKLDASGNPIETYDNNDIVELAKTLTGWSNNFTSQDVLAGPDHHRLHMVMASEFHDNEQASFLGTTIPANTSGEQALQLALNTIANHPNVGPFLARQFIKRLVTSNPSPDYVQRVATVFNADEFGVRGNLSAVLKAILLDPEAAEPSPLNENQKGKLREPILRFIQWGRTFDLDDPTGSWLIYSTASAQSQLGQSPLRSPSVFNFFRPDYIPPNSTLGDLGLSAPELQITNETTVAGYANFMHRKIPTGFSRTVRPDYSKELSLAPTPRLLIDRLNLLLTANQLSPESIDLMTDTLDSMPSNNRNQLLNRVYAAILMIMVSPDYLVLR